MQLPVSALFEAIVPVGELGLEPGDKVFVLIASDGSVVTLAGHEIDPALLATVLQDDRLKCLATAPTGLAGAVKQGLSDLTRRGRDNSQAV